jgi:CRP-like cAMP-binding protein
MQAEDKVIAREYLTPETGAMLLKKLPMFAGYSDSELVRVYAMGELRLYRPQTTIVVEGENSVGMYLILEGEVGVYKAGKGATDGGHLITHLGGGACFGEMSFVDHLPRSASVTAQNQVLAYYLDGEVWQKALDRDLQMALRFYSNFSKILSVRLRTLDEQYIFSQKQLWKYSLTRSME